MNNNSFDRDEELLPEYGLDYSKAKPNRFADRMGDRKLKVVVLDEDVAAAFNTSKAVNEALRQFVALSTEFAEEDRSLAEAGMSNYAETLDKEDQL